MNIDFDNNEDIDVEAECEKIIMLSSDMYSKKNYWDERYMKDVEKNKKFEWYHPWSFFVPHISQYLKCHGNVLNVGAGNSNLSIDLLNFGAEHVFNIDISNVVIEYMKNEYKSNKNLEWIVEDCRKMSFDDDFFDFIIDKGTYDAILCSFEGPKNVKSMFREIYRTLKIGSQFIEIASSNQEDIVKHLTKPYFNWKITNTISINDKNNIIYVYILEKQK